MGKIPYLCNSIKKLTIMKIYKVTVYSGRQEYIYYLKGTLEVYGESGFYKITTDDEELFFPIGRTLIRKADEGFNSNNYEEEVVL